MNYHHSLFLAVVLLLLGSFPANAEGLTILTESSTADGNEYSVKLQILILMTMLSFVPAFFISCTCFTRIIIVLAILRQALGLQQTPPNQVLVGIALIFTLLIMRPVWTEVYNTAYIPYSNDEATLMEALSTAEGPLKQYMYDQTQRETLEQVTKIAGEKHVADMADIPFLILLPAYLLSELKAAFQIGFMLFLPFLVIDLVIASVLMSMGMMMLSPLIVSLPFKLLVFVVVDGWGLLMGSLASTFWINP
ncbi:flagellar type III secretion system pore protein FliP [Photobacterium sp. BZF1]|uniref:flagellar type III secretion system pore protein FliP n=1 Tax=Photobacterium sp. BZF1 TaxID=1904457 RepID=UPI001653EB08|nr:flagellar type III secretion system pore protein FliP [Photobacterium sp. BZF1]MBC7001593.1 flagellar type III secretion system pore protein FliP [Photobacterium sp. BZF1]